MRYADFDILCCLELSFIDVSFQIYMFRLLLEYGRIIDDNRDRIGYSGDGSELDKWDSERAFTFGGPEMNSEPDDPVREGEIEEKGS